MNHSILSDIPDPRQSPPDHDAALTKLLAGNGVLRGPYSAEGEADARWYEDVWKPLAIVTIALGLFALGHRAAELRMQPRFDELEARIAAREAQDTKHDNQIAAVEGHVEEKIAAWAMTEAKHIVDEQQGGQTR